MASALATRSATAYRRSGPSPTVVALRDKLASTQMTLRKARENATGKAAPIMATGLIAAGGIAAALAGRYVPDVMGVDSRFIVGGVGVLVAVFGLRGKMATGLILVSGGVLACAVQDLTEKYLPAGD